MKVFAINLERFPQKKAFITNECVKHNIDVEVIDAVNGSTLSEKEIAEKTFNFSNSFLTKGEIGCAMSHLKIYKKMIDEHIEIAFILEDDAALNHPDINTCIRAIESGDNKNKPNVYLLSLPHSFYLDSNIKFSDDITAYEINGSVAAYAYILNIEAAKSLYKFCYPIRYEADMWNIFKSCLIVNVYSIMPHFVDHVDTDRSLSSLEEERNILFEKREAYRKQLFKKDRKKMSKAKMLKKLKKIFVKGKTDRKIIFISELEDYPTEYSPNIKKKVKVFSDNWEN